MSECSRDVRSHHPRSPFEIVRLQPGDARALNLYLNGRDVCPAPSEPDLAAFLGRSDVVALCANEGNRIACVLACVVEQTTLRIVWLAVDTDDGDAAARLLAEAERFGRASGASIAFAQAAKGSQLYERLAALGFEIGFEEVEVAGSQLLTIVDLQKPLGI